MRVFLSSETQGCVDSILSPIRKSIAEKLDELLASRGDTIYGTDIDILCIITTCVSAQFLQDSGWKERVRYSKKEKMTDIRLLLDYNAFLSSSTEEQYYMYKEHLIESVSKFADKYSKLDFNATLFLNDLKMVLDNM